MMSEGRRFVRHGPSHGFLGVNYFASYRICSDPGTADHASTVIRPQESVTATGWPVDPFGLTDLLARVHQDYGRVPLIITENGAAYEDVVAEGRNHNTLREQYLLGPHHARLPTR